MVPEQYVGKSYLLVGEALRFRRDGVRIRFERGSEPTLVKFEPGDTGVDVGLLLRQRQIVEQPTPSGPRAATTAEMAQAEVSIRAAANRERTEAAQSVNPPSEEG
jgi:hypothetical protein